MAGSPKLDIRPSWITSLTRICCPPTQSGKTFPNEQQKGTVHNVHLLGLSASMSDGTSYTGRTLLSLMMEGPEGSSTVFPCNDGRANILHQSSAFYHHFKQMSRADAAGSGQSFKNEVSLLIVTR